MKGKLLNQRVLVSAATAFAIAVTGSICIAAAAGKASLHDVVVWVVIIATGIGTAVKDMRSSLRMPPVGGGDENAQSENQNANSSR